ncbi:ubiquinone biosynthesis protein COQ9, mitochondrial precursor [Polychaeton citri CBS 116435]|uniref:Ubiquinone biosynthesis protein n=1 Tax=Polychaeton citri CBS 116435 TaxID=1314669 RepID=A0A9P4UQ00_9PEZI|nr:ubiquinone biosynthesis protein COQ9, mitochondrial precursor [Polychaeton citri CBS 116435]
MQPIRSSVLALRQILRTPVTLRPLILQHRASYHSYEEPEPLPYPQAEDAILSAALSNHVPIHGFSQQSLTLGAKDVGYLDISANLFPRGAFELVMYQLVTQRLKLKDRVQFPEEAQAGPGAKVKTLILSRLRANAEAGIVPKYQEALGLMSLAGNIPVSLRELSLLSDEIWFLAGDQAVDGSWYTKRASLAGVYAAAEVYQTQDQSTGFRDTDAFVDRRLEDVRVLGTAVGSTIEWAGFQAGAMVNLLRSKGVRI